MKKGGYRHFPGGGGSTGSTLAGAFRFEERVGLGDLRVIRIEGDRVELAMELHELGADCGLIGRLGGDGLEEPRGIREVVVDDGTGRFFGQRCRDQHLGGGGGPGGLEDLDAIDAACHGTEADLVVVHDVEIAGAVDSTGPTHVIIDVERHPKSGELLQGLRVLKWTRGEETGPVFMVYIRELGIEYDRLDERFGIEVGCDEVRLQGSDVFKRDVGPLRLAEVAVEALDCALGKSRIIGDLRSENAHIIALIPKI